MTAGVGTDVAVFDLGGPLPHGRIVLEASAGTGKTYAIAGLVVRYVAEGQCELAQLLVVTFTRAAAAELRDRVRSRLVAAVAGLDAALAGAPPSDTGDPALAAVLDAPGDELAARRRRVATALADFDAATITTIHGFCQQVLTGLGLVSDLDPDAQLVDDTTDLLEEVVDDVLVARFAGSDDAPIKRSQVLELARTVVGNPDAATVPAPDAVDGEARLRAELVVEIGARFEARKRQAAVLSYDDLLTRLRDALVDPARGAAAAAVLRRRYQVALVDEFQDTDPVQWDILRRAFADDAATLVMIGDPKQAIYAFRGADVHAYLEAVAASSDEATLSTNWRSDGPLVDALDVLFDGVTFGHQGIAYRKVTAAPGRDVARLELPGRPSPPPLRLRCLRRDHELRASKGDIPVDVARNRIAADVTAEVVDLLGAGVQLIDRDGDGVEVKRRDLVARDIAVLARTNAEANLVQRELLAAGVPAIINGVGSVLQTPAAGEWRRLLEALEQPTSVGRVRAATLTAFVGWDAARLAEATDDDLVPVHDRLHRWAEILRDHGVASLVRTIAVTEDLAGRVLARPDGERFLTDLTHVGELLHAAAIADQLGPTALAGWLRARIAEASTEAIPPDERARRLESDDEAVQILTIHRSKGLEFPVVLCPFLWSPGRRWQSVPVYHDPDTGRRTVDVGGRDRDGFDDGHDLAMAEQHGENLRLLYVAVTRARHLAVVWWSPVRNAGESPLGRVLFGRRSADGRDTAGKAPIGNDDRCLDRLRTELGEPSGGRIAIEVAPPRAQLVSWQPPEPDAVDLRAAELGRPVDQRWQRTSYSALTARAAAATYGDGTGRPGVGPAPLSGDGAGRVGSEPTDTVLDDEPVLAVPGGVEGGPAAAAPTLEEGRLRELVLPLGGLPGGAEVGSFVHGVLEEVDFAAADLPAELHRVVDERPGREELGLDTDQLVAGLAAAIATPLGPLAGGVALADVGRDRRMDELGFELPLAGGDDAGRAGHAAAVTVPAIGALLRSHVAAPDPLAGYADHLGGPDFADDGVRGYLTGSIDLVLRVTVGGTDRFVVADYKTNRLAPADEPLTGWHFRPEALAEGMIHGHYPLQALLYQVALHRYLRWRLAGYDPAVHLGGVLYLFLRGMTGADVAAAGASRCGVFAWSPSADLVVATSDLLDRGIS